MSQLLRGRLGMKGTFNKKAGDLHSGLWLGVPTCNFLWLRLLLHQMRESWVNVMIDNNHMGKLFKNFLSIYIHSIGFCCSGKPWLLRCITPGPFSSLPVCVLMMKCLRLIRGHHLAQRILTVALADLTAHSEVWYSMRVPLVESLLGLSKQVRKSLAVFSPEAGWLFLFQEVQKLK